MCVAVRIRALDIQGSVKLRIVTSIELRRVKKDGIKRTDLARRPMLGNWQSLYMYMIGLRHIAIEEGLTVRSI